MQDPWVVGKKFSSFPSNFFTQPFHYFQIVSLVDCLSSWYKLISNNLAIIKFANFIVKPHIHNDSFSFFSVLGLFSSVNCFVLFTKILPFLILIPLYLSIFSFPFVCIHVLFWVCFLLFAFYLFLPLFNFLIIYYSVSIFYFLIIFIPFIFTFYIPFQFVSSFPLYYVSFLLPLIFHVSSSCLSLFLPLISFMSATHMLAAALSYLHSDDDLSSTKLASSAIC